uniref:phosphopantothenoylcysteine decarboxylase domain-containing protein n=1 Tax=Staphylococcus aureus TaxID=1280 RepID=UPI00272E91C8
AKGRMEEPLQIVSVIDAHFQNSNRLTNSSFQDKRALVTAGPTIEVIDTVRFVSNRSSGKMGYAIAEALRNRGAIVTLVAGPTTLEVPEDIEVIHVQSAEEMFEQVTCRFDEVYIFVKAAAVSDYTTVDVLEH